jgi:threonine dehydrogenase-like Zn-dependent dehydrogenase
MRAFVITGPARAEVRSVPEPEPGPGEVVVEVERAGVCGTDMEMFSADMEYLRTGEAAYPLRIGHEWCGVVTALGADVDPRWAGLRVTGDTMLGCGKCDRCLSGRAYLCADRYEIGLRRGWPGALAERLPVPAWALRELPDGVDATAGAMVEPGGNAVRAFEAADLAPGERLLVLGPGTIGLLVALIARARGVEAHVLGVTDASLRFAQALGIEYVWTAERLPVLRYDAVVDASNGAAMPSRALEVVEPGRRVVLIGISKEPSRVDSRTIVFKDLSVVGILGASAGLDGAIDLYNTGDVDPRPLVAATVTLDDVAGILAGDRDPAWGDAPKIHVDPRR